MPIMRDLINIYDHAIDSYWDRKFGIETSQIVETYDLLPDETDHLNSAKKYQAVRTRILKNALKAFQEIDSPEKFKFIDLGSGKGRTLFWAREFKFREYLGIDFSPLLIKIAKDNSREVQFGEFVCNDVLNINFQDEEIVFFLFNPFDGIVLKPFLNHIDKFQSPIYFIYINPILDYLFEMNLGYEKVITSTSLNPNNHFHIYKKISH